MGSLESGRQGSMAWRNGGHWGALGLSPSSRGRLRGRGNSQSIPSRAPSCPFWWLFQHSLLSTSAAHPRPQCRGSISAGPAYTPALLSTHASLERRSWLLPPISHGGWLEAQLWARHPARHPPMASLHVNKRPPPSPAWGPAGLVSPAKHTVGVHWVSVGEGRGTASAHYRCLS